MGGRSRAAADILNKHGFNRVKSLSGGINAWEGGDATGPADWGLELIQPEEGPVGALQLAWNLEHSLRLVYEALVGRAADPEAKALLQKLAAIEKHHEDRVVKMFHALPQEERAGRELVMTDSDVIEGGYTAADINDMLDQTDADDREVISMAMTVEAQGLDLYLRLAEQSTVEASRAALLTLADEERAHLKALGRMMDSIA